MKKRFRNKGLSLRYTQQEKDFIDKVLSKSSYSKTETLLKIVTKFYLEGGEIE